MASPTDSNDVLGCHFCGKSQRQVMKLIAGPGVYICDECVGICNEILDEELPAAPCAHPTATTHQRIAKWRRWIDGTIKSNVSTMQLRRDTWIEVSKIVEENDQLPVSYWWEFMADTYIVTQVAAVRRQVAAHRDVASLGRLTLEIRDDASSLTREWWTGLCRERQDPLLGTGRRARLGHTLRGERRRTPGPGDPRGRPRRPHGRGNQAQALRRGAHRTRRRLSRTDVGHFDRGRGP
jgi:hypothetical protein